MPPTRRVLFTYLTPDTLCDCLRYSNRFSQMFPFISEKVSVWRSEGVAVIHRDALSALVEYKHFDPIVDRENLLRGFVGSIGIKEQAFDVYLTETMNPYDFRVVVSDIADQQLMVQRVDDDDEVWYDNRNALTVCEDEIMAFLLFSQLQETGRVEGMPEIEVKA